MSKKKPKHYWNHRIVTNVCPSGERLFSIHEVYYDNDIPTGYGEKGLLIGHSSIEDIKSERKNTKKAFKKPILDGDNWPNVWEEHDK